MDRLDAVDGENVAGRLALELVRAVRGPDGDRQCVALGFVDEARCLVRIGQELVAGQLALGAVTVLLVAGERLQRAEAAELALDRDADGVREVDHLARDRDVVVVIGGRLGVVLERAVHHHRGEAGADRAHADIGRGAVVLMHDDGKLGVGLDRGGDEVAQERLAGIFARAG